jgi:hypothetical protein
VNIFKTLANKVSTRTSQGLAPKEDYIISEDISNHNNGMRFSIYNAIGGKVVQFSQYDKIKDRHYSSLYIIRDEDDMGQELSQIILREQLSK